MPRRDPLDRLRDIVVHAYFGVDVDILWRTAIEDVPALLSQIRSLVSELEARS